MDCVECDKKKDENIRGYLKFTGGPHRAFKEQGPFNSYETGKIYRVVLRMAELPFWELTDEEPEVRKIREVREVQEVLDPEVLEDEPEDLGVVIEVDEDKVSSLGSSGGITRKLGGKPMSDADIFAGMDDETLKRVIESNGVKVDGRWGRTKLLEEAQKTQ